MSGYLGISHLVLNVVLLIMVHDLFMVINVIDTKELNNLGLIKRLLSTLINYKNRYQLLQVGKVDSIGMRSLDSGTIRGYKKDLEFAKLYGREFFIGGE